MNRIDAKIIALKVNAIFDDRSFSICDFDELAKIAGCIVPADDMKRLRALHCVAYADMDAEIRQWLYQTVVTLVQMPREFPKLELGPPEYVPGSFAIPKPKGFGHRLMETIREGVR